MSEHNAQQGASPQQAQSVVNIAPGEGPAKDVNYDDFTKQLTDLEKQLESASTAEAMDALKQKISALEAEVAKKATKKSLSKKLSEMKKNMQPEDSDDGDDGDDGDEGDNGEDDGAEAEAAAAQAKGAPGVAKHSGKGIVATDAVQNNALSPGYDWFKDLMKANNTAKKNSFK